MSSSTIALPEAPVEAPRLRAISRRRIRVHEDFVHWILESPDVQPQFKKKALHQLQCLMAYGHARGTKSVLGEARGWLRAPLGGQGGFQFYLWYTTHSTSVGKAFGLSEQEVLVRTVRHHDETSRALDADGPEKYLDWAEGDAQVTATDDSTYSQAQRSVVARGARPIQIIRGYPGSGKTTALFLAYLHARPGKTLYLTHSGSLADSARQFFDAFSPEGVSVDVLRFDELLDDLRADRQNSNPILTPSDGADRLMRMLESPNNTWHHKIGDRKDDWYAELHAYAAGRNLPVDFRGVRASSGRLLDAESYVRLRRPEIGDEAEEIAKVLEPLAAHPDLLELFRGPIRARELIINQFKPPPPRLENLVTILVDEVQDLTPIELLLVFNVASRSANASGRLPRILLAGDESQTVRPSGFEWPVVSELVNLVFQDRVGKGDDVQLDENMRSSPQIASFVEATRDQYLKFFKRDRPGGITYTRTNESLHGRLMYCHLKDGDDVAKLGELMSGLPLSVIVYPGHRLPADLPASVAERARVASEVKGLDFDTVVLLDAGERQRKIDDLLAKRDSRPASAVTARTLADQYRVAASRATENLILVDRGSESLQTVVEALSRKVGPESIETVSVDDIPLLLGDELNPEDVIRDLLEEVRRIVGDDPKKARQRYRSAGQQLERARRTRQITAADDLDAEVRRLGCVTAIVSMSREGGLSAAEYTAYRNEALQFVPRPDLSDAVEALFTLREDVDLALSEAACNALTKSAESLDRVALAMPEVARFQQNQLRRWIDKCTEDLAPARLRARERQAARAVRAVTSALTSRYPEYDGIADDIVARWATVVIDQGQFDDGLALLGELAVRRPALDARALRGLARHRDAALAFAEAGEYRDAVWMAREIPDHALATDLASKGDRTLVEETEWAVRLLQATEPPSSGAVRLTEAEQAAVIKAIRSKDSQ